LCCRTCCDKRRYAISSRLEPMDGTKLTGTEWATTFREHTPGPADFEQTPPIGGPPPADPSGRSLEGDFNVRPAFPSGAPVRDESSDLASDVPEGANPDGL
jgi:hypothetical protein